MLVAPEKVTKIGITEGGNKGPGIQYIGSIWDPKTGTPEPPNSFQKHQQSGLKNNGNLMLIVGPLSESIRREDGSVIEQRPRCGTDPTDGSLGVQSEPLMMKKTSTMLSVRCVLIVLRQKRDHRTEQLLAFQDLNVFDRFRDRFGALLFGSG